MEIETKKKRRGGDQKAFQAYEASVPGDAIKLNEGKLYHEWNIINEEEAGMRGNKTLMNCFDHAGA